MTIIAATSASLPPPTLAALLRRSPVCAAPQTPLRQICERMRTEKIGSMLITENGDAALPLLGIFTLRDLLGSVQRADFSLDLPVCELMTRNIISVPPGATPTAAWLTMTRERVHQLPLVQEDGRVCGLISQSDLLALLRGQFEQAGEIGAQIHAAQDIEALSAAATRIHELAEELFAQGLETEALMRWISTLNDALTERVIEIVRAGFTLPQVPWCWMAFGSEGRFEQTLSGDQDNGLIFAAGEGEAEALRARFLPFARAVNEALADCGFLLCPGEIMASNPLWCLSEQEWRAKFAKWILYPRPEALLFASIFFDLRALAGEKTLAENLQATILESARAEEGFLRFMAQNALQCSPALGWFGRFRYDKDKEHPRSIELKKFGSRPFVDAARLFALTQGLRETNTAARLRQGAAHYKMSTETAEGAVSAFHFIQKLRMRQQLRAPGSDANRVYPRQLNELERHILRESFRQAQKLQNRIALEYRLVM